MEMHDRREFLKKGAMAVAGGLLVLLIPKDVKAVLRDDQADFDWTEHYFAYLVDTTKCIGCGNCVRACRNENKVNEHLFRTWVERYAITDTDRVYIDSPNGGSDGFPVDGKMDGEVVKGFFVPKLCNHCRNTPCSQVCPVHASYITPGGVVLVDKEQCIGCGYCVQACPYGSRYIDPKTHTADKCTWCYHRITKGLAPACVSICPTGARRFGNLKEEGSKIKKLIETERVGLLKPQLNTEPYCFYIGLDRSVR